VQNGRFPEDDEEASEMDCRGIRKEIIVGGQERLLKTTGGSDSTGRWDGPIETEVKIARWWDVIDIFTVLGTAGLLLNVIRKFYVLFTGALGGIAA